MGKQHRRAFRGCWLPADIWAIWDADEIDEIDIMLLLLIDVMTDTYSEDGKDCFASNNYLADRMHRSKATIEKRIKKLRKMGLIIVTRFDGRRRYMHTIWSRQTLTETGCLLPTKSGCLHPHRDHSLYSLRSYNSPPPPGGGDSESNTKSKTSNTESKKKTDPRWRRYADRLHSAVFSLTHVDRSHCLSNWANQFRLLHTRDKVSLTRIRKILTWYAGVISDKDPFLPVAHAGGTFRAKFDRLEAARQRMLERAGVEVAGRKRQLIETVEADDDAISEAEQENT